MNEKCDGSADGGRINCPLDELYGTLKTSHDGLTGKEAARRLSVHGPNLLPTQKKARLLQKILVQFKNLFNVLLLVAAGLSFASGIMADDQTSMNMGYAIVAVVVVSILFSVFQERRAEKAIEAIKELVPNNAKALRDGRTERVKLADLVPGDMIVLEEGDRVPADARIVRCFNLSVDNSILTGESVPQALAENPPPGPNANMVSSHNIVLAGTTIVSGSGTAVVIGTGANTVFGKIVAMARDIEEPPSPLQRELDKAAKLDTIVAVTVGFSFLLIAYFFLKLTLTESILFMIGVMICFVPEGLQMTTTLSLAMSSRAMSKRNVIVKRLSSVETLGSTTVICTDKTGTITAGQMTVRAAWVPDALFTTTGEGYNPDGAVTLSGAKASIQSHPDLRALCEIGAFANTSSLTQPLPGKGDRWNAVGDPTEAALLAFATKGGMNLGEAMKGNPRVGMVPFDSTRKMMTSVHKGSDGHATAYVKGAGYEVLSRCVRTWTRDGSAPMTDEMRGVVKARIDGFSKEAYRVLALARREVEVGSGKFEPGEVEGGLEFVGLVAILDPPRPETPEAVHRARSAGIRIVMMTGDHELTAEAIARKVGIITSPDFRVTNGRELALMDDRELAKLTEIPELVFARITPEQKLRIVKAFRKKGEVVAVTGDGVNDAPALLEADIGVAMGLSGTDVARESADMVILDDNFASIVNGVEEGRAVFDNLKKFITYVFCHNWAELVAFLAFILLGTPLPLAVIQVLLIDLLLEIPPSLSLTLEPPEPGLMERLPRSKKSRLFDLDALTLSAAMGVIIGVLSLAWCFLAWSKAGWHLGMNEVPDGEAYLRGMTLVTVGIIAGQLGTLFTIRTSVRSAFSLNVLRNRWLVGSVAVVVLMLAVVIYVPFFHPILSITSISPLEWLLLYSIAPVVVLFDEGRKAIIRSRIIRLEVSPADGAIPGGAGIRPSATQSFAAPDFIERSGPVLLALEADSPDSNAISVAALMGGHSSSKVVVARVLGSETKDWMLRRFDILLENTFGSRVPYERVDILQPSGRSGRLKAGEALRNLASSSKAGAVVIPVDATVFKGSRRARRRYEWLDEFRDVNVVLVAGPTGAMQRRPQRLLLPVFSDFHREQFELASALTRKGGKKDFDVLAVRAIEIPAIVPLYGLRKPETLVDVRKQTKFLDTISSLPVASIMRTEIIMVRNYGRDITSYAEEGRTDVMVLGGEWVSFKDGFLPPDARVIASKSRCAVLVTVARHR